jgi:hypothetical protein
METPSWQLISCLLLAIGFNFLVVRAFFRRFRNQLLLGMVAVHYLFQVLWLGVYLVVSSSSLVWINSEVTINLNSRPFLIMAGMAMMPAVALLVARLLGRSRAPQIDLLAFVRQNPTPMFKTILYVFSTVGPLYFLAPASTMIPALPGILSYAHYSFFVTPVLIGLCWRRCLGPIVAFGLCMLITIAFALAEGSRAIIFLPLAYFAAGWWFTLNRSRRIWTAVAAPLCIVPILLISAGIESVRRHGTKDASRDLSGSSLEMVSLVKQHLFEEDVADKVAQGVGRMIVWSYFTVIIQSPDVVPYRGFDNFGTEIRVLNQSTMFRNTETYLDEMVQEDFGMGVMRLYGYPLSGGGTVPISFMADAWSRGGALIALVFSGFICLCWGLSERVIRARLDDWPHLALALLAVLGSSAYERMGTYGVVYNFRYLFMQLTLWGMIAWLLTKYASRAPNRPTQAPVSGGGWRRFSRPRPASR